MSHIPSGLLRYVKFILCELNIKYSENAIDIAPWAFLFNSLSVVVTCPWARPELSPHALDKYGL